MQMCEICCLLWLCFLSSHFYSRFIILQYVSSLFSEYLSGTEVEAPIVPYEIAASDEKFLQEATKLIGVNLSELDLCHHRVVLKLRNSCHELNAEQLGKLAVMLLNCQSNSEGRALFECTDGMSLKECTSGMDSDTWNAYHLITNRAKAVCVATRHEQFRGLTEITVNKLMASGKLYTSLLNYAVTAFVFEFSLFLHTAHNQIVMMKQLSENQDTLRDLTAQAIDELTEKNEHVIDQQKQILQVSNSHRAIVESNLHELMREKGLIRSGQIEVANMIDSLKVKLDESLMNLKQQSKQMKENQAALLDDLNSLHSNAFQISDKLSETTEYILTQNDLASTQFDQTIRRLSEINEMIEKLQHVTQTLEGNVGEKLAWITNKIGGTDEALTNINLVLQHFSYLLFGMLLLVFINAPAFYRLFFIFAVPMNFICALMQWRNASLIELTQILGIVFACNLIRYILTTMEWKNLFVMYKKKMMQNEKIKVTSDENEVDDAETSQHEEYDKFNADDTNAGSNNNDYSYSYVNAFKQRYRDNDRTMTREGSVTPSTSSNHSFNARSLTPFNLKLTDRTQCIALTLKGDKCRNAAAINQMYCRRHGK